MGKEYLFVVITGIMFGSLVFGGQVFVNMGLSLYEISLFTMVFGLLLLPFIILRKECRFRRDMVGFFLVFGIFGAVTRLSQFGSLVLGVPVAIVVLLLYTQPVWTVIFSKLFLKERLTRHKILAMVLVLTGMVILVNPFTVTDIGNPFGIVVALIGGVALSGFVIYGRRSGVKRYFFIMTTKRYHFITTTFGYMVFTLIILAISYPIMSLFTQDLSIIRVSFNLPAIMWLYLFIFVLVSGIIPYALLFKGEQKVSASRAGIILLLEPVSASILAMLFLQQPLTVNIIIGGALILFSNYLVIRKW